MSKLNIRVGILLLLICILIGGFWLWWLDANSAVNPQNSISKIFIITEGESVRSIATRLKKEDLIRDQIAFFLQVKLKGKDASLQAGDFRLDQTMDIETIIEQLTHGTLDVWVTTLEGWRIEEIAMKLTQKLSIPESEFLQYAKEGYMFPDTYLLPKDATAAAIVTIFKDNFTQKLTDDIQQGFINQGLTTEEGIILASIVEREGKGEVDRPVIAGILLKRWKHDWPLQADATLQYALGYQPETKTWWKQKLSAADKQIASSFNTYKNTGLPPAPICNPGLISIQSVVNPQETDYWYYLHDSQGEVHFARTMEEHTQNIAKFL